jgi:uncharacterized protein YggU (UPF0235/DUF167 family)
VEGAANAALCAFLAKQIGISKSRIRIVSGETARLKIVLLSGDGTSLERRLLELLAD